MVQHSEWTEGRGSASQGLRARTAAAPRAGEGGTPACHPQGPSGGLGGGRGPDDGAPPCLSQARQLHRARASAGGRQRGRDGIRRRRSRGGLTPTRPLAGAPSVARSVCSARPDRPATRHGPRPVLAAAAPAFHTLTPCRHSAPQDDRTALYFLRLPTPRFCSRVGAMNGD